MVRQYCMLYSSLCGRLTVALLEMRALDKHMQFTVLVPQQSQQRPKTEI
uniref:Uncharacterized protein n=1 Tax=Anguilla anguilla TaxID=7936 RepID=A0A0E9QW36_ANGAN